MKRLICCLLCLVCVLILPLQANAALYDDRGTLQHVADQADLLTDQEHIELESRARSLSESSGCDVLIALVENMNGSAAGDYAAALNSGHWWDSDDAVLFLLAMEEREWYIATFGEGIRIFTDYGLDVLGEMAVPYLSEGAYYDGFCVYLDLLPDYFDAWQAGTAIDNPYAYPAGPDHDPVYYPQNQSTSFRNVLPTSLLIGLAVAAVSLWAMRSAMNTKRRQRSAGDYLKQGSFHLRTRQDIFLYSNLSKTRRQQNTSHSGGSSIHRSSGGRSHGGRGGRF